MGRRKSTAAFFKGKGDKAGLAVAAAVSLLLFYGIFKLDTSAPKSAYAERTPEEAAYLQNLRSKYSGKSRSLDVEYARSIISEACGFIDSAKNTQGVYHTPEAVDLLLGTAIAESDLYPRFQDGGGDAIGLFQIEYGTFKDLWERSIKNKHPNLYHAIRREYGIGGNRDIRFEDLQNNDVLSAIFSRMKYAERSEPLPPKDDLHAQAKYYKEIYNTRKGAATPEKYVKKRKAIEGGAAKDGSE